MNDCETHYRGKGLILSAGLNRLFKVHFAPTSSKCVLYMYIPKILLSSQKHVLEICNIKGDSEKT